jgi:uncharacterized protein
VKVVFDTNILVSALTLPGGRGDQALRKIVEGHDSLVLSKHVLDELLGVLARKFARSKEELARVAVFLAELGELVEAPAATIHVLGDEPDNRILECALAGRAHAIVTGDRAMLGLAEFEGIQILSLREFLDPE